MNIYTYKIDDKTYINLTNECTNDCEFCVRRTGDGVGGYDLWLKEEPTARDIILQLQDKPKDVVFCGFGEPTLRLEVLIEVAEYVKSYGGHVRVNTNGHANEYYGKDVTPSLAKVVDQISISLNEADAKKYDSVVKSIYGEKGFTHMLEFAKKCVECGIRVTLSVVDVISEEDINTCREIAENMGAEFRVRHFIP